MKDKLRSMIPRTIISVSWTHKTLEKQAEMYEFWSNIFLYIQKISAGVTSVMALALFSNWQSNFCFKVILAVAGILSFACSEIRTQCKFESKRDQCKQQANKQFILREELNQLLADFVYQKVPNEEVDNRYKKLFDNRLKISGEQPPTWKRANKKATKELKEGSNQVDCWEYKAMIDNDLLSKLKDM